MPRIAVCIKSTSSGTNFELLNFYQEKKYNTNEKS